MKLILVLIALVVRTGTTRSFSPQFLTSSNHNHHNNHNNHNNHNKQQPTNHHHHHNYGNDQNHAKLQLQSQTQKQTQRRYGTPSLPMTTSSTTSRGFSSDNDNDNSDDNSDNNDIVVHIPPGGSASDNSGTGTGTATIPSHVFNLVKGIVGAGVLALPSGIATYGDSPSAVLPAIFLIVLIGTLSGYGFGLIGRVCSLTDDSTSYREAWRKSISDETSWIPAVSVTFKTICAVLAYSMILGDTFYSLLVSAGYTTISKHVTLSVLTGTILLPLCLLRNLSSLAPFSLLGTLGMIYTAIAMSIRYFTKAYVYPMGMYVNDLPKQLQPSFGTSGAAASFSPTTSILLGMLSTAYMAHFNAPKFYTELSNNTIPRYLRVVTISFGISILLFAIITSVGFLTFGKNCSGLILNNYSTRDTLMGLSRVAVAISLVFSYPLAFTGARDGVMDLIGISKKKQSNATFLNALTVTMLTGITTMAMIIPDVSFVLAFAGATLGNGLIYIYPGLMFRGAIKRLPNPTPRQKREVIIAMTSAVVGTALGILGAVKAVQSIL